MTKFTAHDVSLDGSAIEACYIAILRKRPKLNVLSLSLCFRWQHVLSTSMQFLQQVSSCLGRSSCGKLGVWE
jgi:hypothetical protein